MEKIFALFIILSGVLAGGCRPSDGVPDMTVISDIDSQGINKNLKVRYERDQIYVRNSPDLSLQLVDF